MARFNTKGKVSTKTTNYEGEEAYTLSPELELYSLVCTSFMNNKFYRTAKDEMERMRDLIKQVDPKYVAQLAIYAREEMYLRTIPVVLMVELAKVHKGDELVEFATERIIQRADELTEILACYAELNGRKRINKLSVGIRKGVANACNKFGEYHFSKYNRKGLVTLKDVISVVHPVPESREQSELFKKVLDGNLETPYTWEVELSKQDGRSKKEKWEELIESGKLGYMATIRNLRNFLQEGIEGDTLDKVCEFISTKEAVKKSRQLPFRFFNAYRMIKEEGLPGSKKVLNALEDAASISIDNIEFFNSGRNAIACDLSGSMSWTPISERSNVFPVHIGCVLGSLLSRKLDDAVTYVFADKIATLTFTGRSPLQDALDAVNIEVGGSTNGYKVIRDMIQKNLEFDRVFFFTDCQLWDSNDWTDSTTLKDLWIKYTEEINPDAELYIFDLTGYGNTPISTLHKNVYFIAGWSDKIFEMLGALQRGSLAVEEIKRIEI